MYIHVYTRTSRYTFCAHCGTSWPALLRLFAAVPSSSSMQFWVVRAPFHQKCDVVASLSVLLFLQLPLLFQQVCAQNQLLQPGRSTHNAYATWCMKSRTDEKTARWRVCRMHHRIIYEYVVPIKSIIIYGCHRTLLSDAPLEKKKFTLIYVNLHRFT